MADISDIKIKRDFLNYSKLVYPRNLNENEINIIKNYTTDLYTNLNEELRNNDKITHRREISILDSAIRKFHFNGSLITYRDLLFFDSAVESFLKKIERGYMVDKAYSSTSLEPNSFLEDYTVRMQIEVPDINVGALISFISRRRHENEFILKRNTKFEILDIKEDYDFNKKKIYYVKSRVIK